MLAAQKGALSTQALVQGGLLMGLKDVTIRMTLSRLVADGKIARDARGSYQMPPQGFAIQHAVRAWREKHAMATDWNGRWVAVHDAEVRRADRTVFRRHLRALELMGYKPLRHGLRLRPDNLQGGVAGQQSRLPGLGLAPCALVVGLGDLDAHTAAAARRLWNADTIDAENQRYTDLLNTGRARFPVQALDMAVRDALLLGREVIAHLVKDPLLPPELMSPDSRSRLLEAAARYQDEARRLWRVWLDKRLPRP